MGRDVVAQAKNLRFVKLIACDEVDEDFGVKIERNGAPPLAVFRLGSDFFVVDDTCSHGDASLSDGELLPNGEVSCPFHGGTFDIRSGAPCKYPCTVPIRTYKVQIIDECVWAELEECI